MNALQLFLLENPVDGITREIEMTGRLKGHKITIRPLTSEEHTQCTMLAADNIQSAKKRSFNAGKFSALAISAALVEPSMKDAAMLKSAGVRTPEALVNKLFLPGEKDFLIQEILELSGFNTDMDEDVEDVKNS